MADALNREDSAMFRQFLPFAVLASAILGCSQSDKPPPDPNNTGPDVADPNATYTIKLREQQKGDKTHVTKTRTGSTTAATGNTTQTQTDKLKYDFIETALDTAPGEPRPTKVTRVYTVSERSDPKGGMKSASHVGKTISIEKFRDSYKYAVNGGVMVPSEQQEVHEDFAIGKGGNFDGMLPKSAVKVGEEWTVDFAAVKAFQGKQQFTPDKDKSKITGKLIRAYKKDGQQWGVIEWKVVLIIDTHATNGSPIRGSMPSTITLDTAIDGSVRAATIKVTTQGKIDHRDIIGHEVKTTIDGTQEQTLTPVQ